MRLALSNKRLQHQRSQHHHYQAEHIEAKHHSAGVGGEENAGNKQVNGQSRGAGGVRNHQGGDQALGRVR